MANNDINHLIQDGTEARKPDYAISRSEKSALVSNQAAEHELRSVLRTINNMRDHAVQAHTHQLNQFLDSISDDVLPVPEKSRVGKTSQSENDASSGQKKSQKADSSQIRHSSSGGDLRFPAIQRKSSTESKSTGNSPRNSDKVRRRKKLSDENMRKTINLIHLEASSNASSCPNSPVTRRKRPETLDINILSGTERFRTNSFTEHRQPQSPLVERSQILTPRQLRAQVEKNIQLNLESAKQETSRRKKLSNSGNESSSWESQIARDQIERYDRSSQSTEDDSPTSPYSISSTMKISSTSGTFEKKTGKQGLKAWMGKPGIRNSKIKQSK